MAYQSLAYKADHFYSQTHTLMSLLHIHFHGNIQWNFTPVLALSMAIFDQYYNT